MKKEDLSIIILSFALGFCIATTYWVKRIPEDYKRLYDKQSDIIGRCINTLEGYSKLFED